MKLNEVKLDLSPGEIYRFNTKLSSIHFAAAREKRLVDHTGNLDRSYLYFKLSAASDEQGMFSRMPMHTLGTPDCKALNLVGKWIRSWESAEAADKFQLPCAPAEDFEWVEEDFTWPQSEKYVPRRADWADAQVGMPERFRALEFPEGLRALAAKKVAVGYWTRKASCRLPTVDLPPEKQRPWMLNHGLPKRPFGEVYETSPGAYRFLHYQLLQNCHGPKADGQSSFAKALLNWSAVAPRGGLESRAFRGRRGQSQGLRL